MMNTSEEYEREIARAIDIFRRKTHDYGASWRVMRISSLIDQIFIKAQRLRSIEDKGQQKVSDPIEDEYFGIINYAILTLIQMELEPNMELDTDFDRLLRMYEKYAESARALMLRKNHDYGEAWRQMQISSFTDLILTKLLRIRQILAHDGQTLASEGIDSNLYDMINYAIFALIRMR